MRNSIPSTAMLVAPFLLLALMPPAHAASTGNVLQGGVARWSGLDARECGIFGRRYAAIDGTCFFPIDMKANTGVHEVAVYDAAGKQHLGALTVEARECTETEIMLDRTEYVEVSAENRTRAASEREATLKAVKGESDAHPRFSLPLGAPASGAGTKDRSDFCEKRLYNNKIRSVHTGLDYLIGKGTQASAPADGTVVLAADQFYSGNSVMVDHGGGLVTMVFHLDTLAVESGAQVKRGDALGTVGETGRATGPHLHFGARWHGQRIDAAALLGETSKLPGIGEGSSDAPDEKAVERDANQTTPEDAAGE
jgi:murein DD-endopeptidase MepM/ murein hydrolase activator NlpD